MWPQTKKINYSNEHPIYKLDISSTQRSMKMFYCPLWDGSGQTSVVWHLRTLLMGSESPKKQTLNITWRESE